MEEEEAHNLYQHFQKTDAAAKQKQVQCCARNTQLTAACCFGCLTAALCLTQGLGFGSSPAPPHLVDSCKKPAGWEAPYKLSDKFQQAPEVATSKRSRSSHSHRHSPEKQQRAHSSSSPDRSLHHSRDNAVRDRQSHKGQGSTRHSSRQKHRKELRHSSSRKRHSESPDGHDHRISHRRTLYSESPDSSHRRSHHSSKHSDSKRDSNKHSRRQPEPSHSCHERHRSRHTDHRSREEDHQQRHSSRNRRGDDQTNRALKAPDYAKLIVGYKYMSDANRLKAVTAYKLSKTSAKVQSTPSSLTMHIAYCSVNTINTNAHQLASLGGVQWCLWYSLSTCFLPVITCVCGLVLSLLQAL